MSKKKNMCGICEFRGPENRLGYRYGGDLEIWEWMGSSKKNVLKEREGN